MRLLNTQIHNVRAFSGKTLLMMEIVEAQLSYKKSLFIIKYKKKRAQIEVYEDLIIEDDDDPFSQEN